MPEWKKEKRTDEFRLVSRRVKSGPNPFDTSVEKTLQQKWIVTVGGLGYGFEEIEDWRDVPVVSEE